jgi:nucleoside-diphosphate-sugar epimerase
MIIGNGLIGSAFKLRLLPDEVLIFASGVSNSKEVNEDLFQRELDLLLTTIKQFPRFKLVYFSTASVMDPNLQDDHYVKHKLRCERLVVTNCKSYLILRVTNVVGKSSNPFTVFNFLSEKIKCEEPFEIWQNGCRNFVDISDLVEITISLLHENIPVNSFILANPYFYSVPEIVERLEIAIGKKANCRAVDKGTCFRPELSETLSFYEKTNFKFHENYLDLMIQKYLQ